METAHNPTPTSLPDRAGLAYWGRDRIDRANFRLWGASRHQQYFTPAPVAQAIYKALAPLLLEGIEKDDERKLDVLDPTCGSGRLLYPWQRDGRCRVVGIELDAQAAEHARHLLGDVAVRLGDVLAYRPYLKGQNFGLAVVNPPHALDWEYDSGRFETGGYAGMVRSENACMEIAVEALHWAGVMVAILPSHTFEKDRKLAGWLTRHCALLARLTVNGLFKPEYGIEVAADVLLFRKRISGDEAHADCYRETLDYDPEAFVELFSAAVAEQAPAIGTAARFVAGDNAPAVPHLSRLLAAVPAAATAEVTARGVQTSPVAAALLGFLDECYHVYNQVAGRYTGLAEAHLSRPALIWRGVEPALACLRQLGIEAKISKRAAERLAHLQERFALWRVPMRPPGLHQRLAWFENRDYPARRTVKKAGTLWFRQGKSYRIRPAWRRQRDTVKIEAIVDGRGKKTGELVTEVDRGFLVLAVETEFGRYDFEEHNAADVELLLEAFHLPAVPDIEDERPELVAAYRDKLETLGHFGGEFAYQLEDVARLAVKPFGYLGWEQGGGKSMAAAAWAWARGYQRVLVVCQSSLLKNWLNELDKFGFKRVSVIASHADIDRLRGVKRGARLRRVHEAKLRDGGLAGPQADPEFYLISYEFLSLDTKKVFDPWDCRKWRFDKELNKEIIVHEVTGKTGEHCSECGREHREAVTACPACQASPEEGWTGQVCRRCGHRAYTYLAAAGRQYPAYKRLRKLFSAVILDEAQMAKSKLSDRGRACRALRCRGRLVLTGTLMRGYVWDTYFNISWLLGFDNPLFPYPRLGGERRFLREFATDQYQFASREFKDTLQKGKRHKALPEVSNLNRFWRLLASFTLRRLKGEMVKLPEKRRFPIFLAMDQAQQAFYGQLDDEAKDAIKKALRLGGEKVNMGVISTWLWRLRFASTVPTTPLHLPQPLEAESWNKLEAVLALVHAFRDNRQKGVVYTGLPEFGQALVELLRREKLNVLHITAQTPTRKRFELIRRFTHEAYWDCIVAGLNVLNRGFTILPPSANGEHYKPVANVVITDLDYSPEPMVQAEDRVHRTGQQHPVNVFYLLNAGTIDQVMLEKVTQKMTAIEQAIDGKALHADTASVLARLAESESVQLQIARAVATSEPFQMSKLSVDNIRGVIERVFGRVTEHERNRETVALVDVDQAFLRRQHRLPPPTEAQLLQLALF